MNNDSLALAPLAPQFWGELTHAKFSAKNIAGSKYKSWKTLKVLSAVPPINFKGSGPSLLLSPPRIGGAGWPMQNLCRSHTAHNSSERNQNDGNR